MRIADLSLVFRRRLAGPRPAFYIVGYDGAQRATHIEPPLEALERGPVWIIDAIDGHFDYAVEHASIVRGQNSVLVLYDDGELRGAIETQAITSYETVTILDPEYATPYGNRLWQGFETGNQLALVHAYTGDFH